MGLDNPLHIAFIVVLVLLVFGAKRLPEIGRSLGTGMREFKQSISGETPSHTPTQAHEPERPTLPAAAPPPAASPQPAPVQQAPPPEAAQAPPPTQAEAQDAFAQRDPAATDRR